MERCSKDERCKDGCCIPHNVVHLEGYPSKGQASPALLLRVATAPPFSFRVLASLPPSVVSCRTAVAIHSTFFPHLDDVVEAHVSIPALCVLASPPLPVVSWRTLAPIDLSFFPHLDGHSPISASRDLASLRPLVVSC